MSIEDDDDYDLDDEVLDEAFEEDLEEGLDDFDEEMSFDEDEALFEDDDEYTQLAAQEQPGAQKKKLNIDIGFDKIAIIGAILVGVIVLVYQVTTKTAEQRVEIFQSVLTMKGATDGEVFGESQSENIATVAPESKENQKAFLYEPEALNDLPDNLKDGELVLDSEITAYDGEKTNARRDQSGEFLSGRKNERAVPIEEQKGEFVSITGELVKKPTPKEQRPVQREPVQETPEKKLVNMDEVKSLPTIDTSGFEQEQEKIDSAKKELNFVPLDKIAVKQKDQKPRPPAASENLAPKMIPEKTTMWDDDEKIQSADDTELLVLKAEIQRLKSEKMALQRKAAALQEENDKIVAVQSSVQSDTKQAEKPAVKEISEDAMEVSKAEPQPELVKPIVKKPVKKAAPAPKKTVETVTNWQLRAAQPGKAWISSQGKRDMIAVTVGDTVKDLGKIVAISNQNGKWVVLGSEGQVRQ